jgi:hypothetical protein
MSIKVVITGPYCTGKTTLHRLLIQELTQGGLTVAALPDVARECPLPLNDLQSDYTSLWLIGTQIAREAAAALSTADVVLCDRGIPDILAHHQDVTERDGETILASMQGFLENWLETYDILLYSTVDYSKPIEPDGLRLVDETFREKLAGYAWNTVEPLGERLIVLPVEGGARLPVALQAIKRRCSDPNEKRS